ncbi:hypothetical protein A8H39_03560 [Paraburkholderia fungorum]|nr:hypothetical protein A8H39_03560 [Paraburkholderia fungorum]QLD54340.1 hypothetical protein C9419_34890 [Paraburkholderia fungorum]
MPNILMVLIVAMAGSSLCACSVSSQTRSPDFRSKIVVHEPAASQGDFVLCKDGRVLVFPVSHPMTCS